LRKAILTLLRAKLELEQIAPFLFVGASVAIGNETAAVCNTWAPLARRSSLDTEHRRRTPLLQTAAPPVRQPRRILAGGAEPVVRPGFSRHCRRCAAV